MRSRAAAGAWAIFVAIGVSGCGGGAPRAAFDLAARQPIAASLHPVLAVNEPSAAPPFPTDRIVVRAAGQQVAYIPDAQWADRLPRIVQARLIEQFGRGHIGAALPGGRLSATLASDIRRFEIDAARQMAVVEISAQLLDTSSGETRAARVFVAEAQASSVAGPAAAQALDEALDTVIRQMTGWLRGRLALKAASTPSESKAL
jgi:cholesterol transport system auxiliary component